MGHCRASLARYSYSAIALVAGGYVIACVELIVAFATAKLSV